MLCTCTKYNLYLHSLIKSNGIHSSIILNSSRQTGNAMRKVLGSSKKKKFHFSEVPKMSTPDVLSKGLFEGKLSGNSRRATVLNKLFMKHITDQMSTGECSSIILGHGVEVNRVQITPDYKIVRVYYTAKRLSDAATVLERCSGILRHELSQLRIMGNIPIIQFVKDKHYGNTVELDNRIAIADFGEDYVPQINLADKYKSELEILTPLDNDIKEKLKELDSQKTDIIEDLPLPSMPQNVLGIPHAEIVDRIIKSVKKGKALHRTGNVNIQESQATVNTINTDPVCLGDPKSQRAVFREFLRKRQLLRLKVKSENCIDSELEYLDEIDENRLEHSNRFNIAVADNEDYIVEDIDEKDERKIDM